MAQALASFDTSHAAPIHDAQLDYYGKRLATCSSDHSVRVWLVDSENKKHDFNAELKHDASVWQVSWGHPKFGTLLATACVDAKVTLWRETRPFDWQIVFSDLTHRSSVNGVSFGPWEYGLALASCSTDGSIIIFSKGSDENGWSKKIIKDAHAGGVTSLSWATATSPATLAAGPACIGATLGPKRIVSGGCDNFVRIWEEPRRRDGGSSEWIEVHSFGPDGPEVGHSAWVRDVSWRPNCGIPTNMIVSVGDDQHVIFWKQAHEQQKWEVVCRHKMESAPCKVSWSVTGSIACISFKNDAVVFKEALDGQWQVVTSLKGQGDSET